MFQQQRYNLAYSVFPAHPHLLSFLQYHHIDQAGLTILLPQLPKC